MNFDNSYPSSIVNGLKLLTIILLAITISSCGRNKEETFSIGQITHENRLDEFIDEIPRYYGKIDDISHHNGLIYFADNGAGKVFVTNEDLNYQFEFLSLGQGPDEARYFGRIVPADTQLVLADYLGRKFMVFSEQGKLSKNISPVSHNISSANYFIKDQQIHYYHRRSDSIKVVDFNAKLVKGIPFPWSSLGMENRNTKSELSIFQKGENYLFLCHDVLPVMGIIDSGGKLIDALDLSSLDLLAGMITKQKELGENSNSSLVFFNDAKLYGDMLYVIAGTRNQDGEEPYYNHLLSISITEKGLKLENVSKLDASRWYMNFVILPKKKQIIAFDPSMNGNHIDVYSFQ